MADPEKPQQPEQPQQKPAGPVAQPAVYSENFPALLEHLGATVLVTTYQAGRLVLIRAAGGVLYLYAHPFAKPMGLAVQGNRLAIGTALEIWEFHNAPAFAPLLQPQGTFDACYLPRGSNTTGNIQIHEMAFTAGDLLFINTRFSCLCFRSGIHSFVPRWKPPFISTYAPEDRCHLNGLCVAGNVPAFVTALGATDTEGGWRADKRAGGILMDLPDGNILLSGLSMPHSPRWYGEQLWLLESGNGGVGVVDPAGPRYVQTASLPGFTRGMDFCGPYAFVGLSQVRESAIFSGIAIAEKPVEERFCGVWVIDTRTGREVAWLKFTEVVQEIFAVSVLPGMRAAEVINDNTALIADAFVLPDEAVRNVPAPLRFPAPTSPAPT
jgi:uncharacterized protein (TIGR03032 family)